MKAYIIIIFYRKSFFFSNFIIFLFYMPSKKQVEFLNFSIPYLIYLGKKTFYDVTLL